MIKYLLSLPWTPASPQLWWQHLLLVDSMGAWLWQRGQGGKHMSIAYPLQHDRGQVRAVTSA